MPSTAEIRGVADPLETAKPLTVYVKNINGGRNESTAGKVAVIDQNAVQTVPDHVSTLNVRMNTKSAFKEPTKSSLATKSK